MKKPRTEAQREASRRNGKLSKGPITQEGKDKVRFNAVQTGITAETILLPGECRASYDAHHLALWQRYQPQDAAEDLAVEAIIVHEWRLRRCWMAEQACCIASGEPYQKDPILDRILRAEARLDRQLRSAISRLNELRDRGGLEPDLPPAGPTIQDRILAAQEALIAQQQAAAAAPNSTPPDSVPSGFLGVLRAWKNKPTIPELPLHRYASSPLLVNTASS